jgi:hypothetical protein
MPRFLVGALLGALAVLATCALLALKDQVGSPERLVEVQGPHGEWYALYAEYPLGDYDPSWHVYRFATRAALDSAHVERGFNKGALFETYEESGDHDEDAVLEVLDGRFLVFSKAGIFHSLFDIECKRLLVHEEDPYHAATSGGMSAATPGWPRFYLKSKLEHLQQPIERAIQAKARCAG